MTNESLNLESKILKLEGIMDELESIGINTADKRATLNSTINKKVILGNTAYEEMSEANKLQLLEKVTSELLEYSDLLNISRIINFLTLASDESAEEKVEETMKLINLLKVNREKLSTNHKLLRRVYSSIYDVIKMEYTLYLRSDILETILDSKEDVVNIEALVEKDIIDLKKNTFVESKEALDLLLTEEARIKLKEINPSLVTEKIILLLVICTNKERMSENFKMELEFILRRLSTNSKAISNNTFYDQKFRLTKRLLNIKKIREDYKKKLIALVLSFSLFTGVSLTSNLLIKRLCTKELFNTTKETIELINGEYYRNTDNYYGTKVSEDEKIVLRLYNQLYTNTRNFTEYDLKNAIKDTAENYLNIDLNSGGVSEKFVLNDVKNYEDDEFYLEFSEGYRELTLIEQDLNDGYTDYNEKFHYISLAIIYLVLLISAFTPIGPIKKLREILELKKDYKSNIKDWDKTIKIIEEYIDSCKLKVEENKLLKEKIRIMISSGILELEEETLKGNIKRLLDELEQGTVKNLDEFLRAVVSREHSSLTNEENYKKLKIKE